MVSVCLPSDVLLQFLPSYLGFSYLGRGVSLHGCSSKTQKLILTLDEGYLLITAPPDIECGIAPLGSPVPVQRPLLGCRVAPSGGRPRPPAWGSSSRPSPWTPTEGGSFRLRYMHRRSRQRYVCRCSPQTEIWKHREVRQVA